jgi:hypothetical protein
VLLAAAAAAASATALAALASIVALAAFVAKVPDADRAMSVPLGAFNGGTVAPPPVWLSGHALSEEAFCVPGAFPAEEDCEARPSCGRPAGFWLEGGDVTGGGAGAGAGSPASSSNAANGPVWSVESAADALRAPWPRLAWRTALASETALDTSYLLKGIDPGNAQLFETLFAICRVLCNP